MNIHRENETPLTHISLPIEGMTCASCVLRVERAVAKTPGVSSVAVNLATESADITFQSPHDLTAIAEAVANVGYKVGAQTIDLAIDGMTRASCVRRVESAIQGVAGVLAASVNLATETATVRVAGAFPFDAIDAAVRTAGYGMRRIDPGIQNADRRQEAKDRELGELKRDLTVAGAMTLPIFLLEMGMHTIEPMHHWVMGKIGENVLYSAFFVLATIVQFGPGLRFYRKGIPSLMRMAPDMNALVVLGSTAAWAYSVVATFAPAVLPDGTANVYFEASAVIVTLILLGRFLEAKAKGRTSEAIKRLMGLQAKSARVERDGNFVEISLELVRVGDVIQVRPGDKIPVDGVIMRGSSFVDESMISGEPVPVAKDEDSEVIGGTINKSGSFVYRATKVGADTVLAQIVKMVEAAQGSKLPIQAMVDKVTSWFVPAVMGAAGLTFLVWLIFGPEPALTFALVNGVAVLIIACPCAMGLATPTSIMVGTGRAAELGVLFRNGEALQKLKGIEVVAFDKTGTLTLGKPRLTDLIVADGYDRSRVLTLIASAETQSEHPVAAAIVSAAAEENLVLHEPDRFEAISGFGISARVDNHDLIVGADRFLAQYGISTNRFADLATDLGRKARTPLYAAIDGELAAIVAVADPIKPTSRAAIAALHALKLKTVMVTGDNSRTAEAIARELGIDEVVAEVLPDGKVEAIKRLRGGGGVVAFVGDGINDAPALAEADVGIAIGTGTDIAIESADVVLMSGDLIGVTNAIALSKATLANIRQNLFWAFAYNAGLIPVAAGALYPSSGMMLSPMLAAGAMALSSVFVLGNAMRLKRFRTPEMSNRRDIRSISPAILRDATS